MTYNEWLEKNFFEQDRRMVSAEMAWNAAIKEEREACAKVCESQAGLPECPERAQYCADAIRGRTNKES